MKCSLIWRNCFVRELDIPIGWMNVDVKNVKPLRQDIFWVECTSVEAFEQLLPLVDSVDHKTRIMDVVKNKVVAELCFVVARELQWVQYWPYLNVNASGSLWEKFGETYFTEAKQIKSMEKQMPGDI